MEIITITLNPAFDLHCFCADFKPFHENLCDINSYDAGGKGINVSRALTVNNIPNTALTILGEENADAFLKELSKENINCKYITVKGRIRENITLHSESQPETRISFLGFYVDCEVISNFKKLLFNQNLNNSIVTFTGRIPNGIDKNIIKEMLADVKKSGAKLVVDSKSFDLNDLLELKPFLIKPNEEEISEYVDTKVTDLASAEIAANSLKSQGIENVIISLGDKGAILACADGIFCAKPPQIMVKSTVGAGDSMIAGFLSAISNGYTYIDALRLSIAFGTAACTTIGTKPPSNDTINSIFDKTIFE